MTRTTTAAATLIAALLIAAHHHTSRRITALEHELADRQQREREKGRRLINTPRDEPPDEHPANLRVLPGGLTTTPPAQRAHKR